MVCFFGSEIVSEKSQVDDDKIGSRVRSVEYSLKSSYAGSVYPVVNRRCSSEAPVREIWRESEVEEDGFVEYEPYENPYSECRACRDKEYFYILRDTSYEETASVFCHEKSDEKFEIIPSAVNERCKSESINQSNYHKISDVRTDQIIEDIELRKYFPFPEIEYEYDNKRPEEYLFEEIYPWNGEFTSEKYTCKYTPRKEDEKYAENTIEHGLEITRYEEMQASRIFISIFI